MLRIVAVGPHLGSPSVQRHPHLDLPDLSGPLLAMKSMLRPEGSLKGAGGRRECHHKAAPCRLKEDPAMSSDSLSHDGIVTGEGLFHLRGVLLPPGSGAFYICEQECNRS